MITRRTAVLGLTAAIVLPLPAAAARKPPVYAPDGVAVGGHDPVAYFTEGRPVPGNPDITSEWMGALVRFSSAENKATFDADPERYAPRFGGYCAYAVSRGYTASGDPEAWTVHEDRLYLNFSKSVRALWSLRKESNIAKAEANWPDVLDE